MAACEGQGRIEECEKLLFLPAMHLTVYGDFQPMLRKDVDAV